MESRQGDAAKSVLVAYASRFGTTVGVAEVVAETARRADWHVRFADMGQIMAQRLQPESFDLVILGAPIRYDRWLAEARDFVRRNRAALRQTRTAAFFTCLTLSRPDQPSRAQAEHYASKIAAILPRTEPRDIGGFAGVLDFAKFPLLQRPFARILMSTLGVREGDYRDWSAIKTWAQAQLDFDHA
jgi:menaquinone-dependent protoporphyrinogen oxidase